MIDTLTLCENCGHRWAVLSNDSIGKRMIEGYEYEDWVWAKLEPYLSSDKVFIDAGAYIGCFTVRAAPLVRTVHAFEPLRTSRTLLEINVGLNRLDNVIVHDVALGNPRWDDPTTMHNEIVANQSQSDMEQINIGGAAHLDSVLHDLGVNSTSEWRNEVGVIKLDWLDIRDVGVMKIDVQASEFDLLRGAKETIERELPAIFIELVRWQDEQNEPSMAWLRARGYELIQIRGWDWMALP